MPTAAKALLFDVFGTVVDWRSSLIASFTTWGKAKGVDGDWAALVDGWRGAYMPSMDDVRKHPERGFVILDTLQRQSIEPLCAKLGITGLKSEDYDYLTRGWHSLNPWPDSETYLGAAKILGLAPAEVMLVAAHNNDLAAAQSFGLKTAFVPRVTEYGPHQVRDFEPDGNWDFVAEDFNDLASQLGC